MSLGTNIKQGKLLLSFDGGGVGVLSSLLILREIMFRVQQMKHLSEPPLPCDHFDLIAGCGFGGLVAIMLGRLRMPVDKAIESFCSIVFAAFSAKKRSLKDARTKNLERAIADLVNQYVQDGNSRMMDLDDNGSRCKTFVCVALGHNLGGTERLRTYLGTKQQAPNCTIEEAMLATTAIPGIFEPRVISESVGLSLTYVAADLVSSNPTAVMLEEAREMFPDQHISCVINLGSGLGPVATILDSDSRLVKDPDELVVTLGLIAKDREKKAQEMQSRFEQTPNFYFRFNVEQGMQSVKESAYKQLPAILAHTRGFVSNLDSINPTKLNNAAKAIAEKEEYVASSHLVGAVYVLSNQSRIQPSPPPSPNFTGREEVLQIMLEYFTTPLDVQRAFVLHGLGGSGKTQIARMFIHGHRALFSEVYHIDASSPQTIESDFINIVRAKSIGQTVEDAFYYFITNISNWVIFYDNADDDQLDLRNRYFPHCAHGNLLITTRNKNFVMYARGSRSDYKVSGMSPGDAEKLLMNISTGDNPACEYSSFGHCPGYHALAITQTAAYILVQDYTLGQYLQTCHKDFKILEKCLLAAVPTDDDYGQTTFATWMLSYRKLTDRTRQLLNYLAYMHHNEITEDIFCNAHAQYRSQQDSLDDSLVSFLSLFDGQVYNSKTTWDSSAFRDVMAEPRSYSLIDYDRQEGIYSVHPLVHQWIRKLAPSTVANSVAALLSLCVTSRNELDDISFRRTLMPHIDALPEAQRAGESVASQFSVVYREAGRWLAAQELETKVHNSRKQKLGEIHPDTLSSLHILGEIYRERGQWNEAEKAHRVVLESRKGLLEENADEILESAHQLAWVYLEQMQWKLACELEEFVLSQRKRSLKEDDPKVVESMSHLAWAYWGLERCSDAQSLEETVVNLHTRRFSRNHPVTQKSIHNLAKTYAKQNLLEKAEALLEEVFHSRSRFLGERHPHTLLSTTALAEIYFQQDRLDEAETLQLKVIEISSQVLCEHHPRTLEAMESLAVTYDKQKQWERAENLMIKVIGEQKAICDFNNHPSSLNTLNNLARIYSHQRKWHQACEVMEEVVKKRKYTREEDHPDTLRSLRELEGWKLLRDKREEMGLDRREGQDHIGDDKWAYPANSSKQHDDKDASKMSKSQRKRRNRAMRAANTGGLGTSQPTQSAPITKAPPPTSRISNREQPSRVPQAKFQVTRRQQKTPSAFLKLPADILAQVVPSLLPIDVINLAKVNTTVRKVLMHRSASTMWRACIENAGLPECPEELSEPRYVSVLHLPICSSCGAQEQRKPDCYLLVRLCGRCRRDILIDWRNIEPEELRTVVFASNGSRFRSESMDLKHSLGQEVQKTKTYLNELKSSNNEGVVQAWMETKKVELETRTKRGDLIIQWVEKAQRDKLQALRDEWRKQAECRLIAAGYSPPDEDFPSSKKEAYLRFFNRTNEFTEYGWDALKPRIIDLLETEAKERPERQRKERRYKRESQLRDLVDQLLKRLAVATPEGLGKLSLAQKTTFLVEWLPLPKGYDVLKWPIFDGWVEPEIPVEAITDRFKAQREEITQLVQDWGRKVKQELATIIREGRKEDRLADDPPQVSLSTIESERASSGPVDIDTSLLLRADSFLESKDYSRVWTYDRLAQDSWMHRNIDSGALQFHSQASSIARALLKSLGRPDALGLEFVGDTFRCGRCYSYKMSFYVAVRHYMEQSEEHKGIQPLLSKFPELGISYNNMHDPDFDPSRPLLIPLSPQEVTDVAEKFERLGKMPSWVEQFADELGVPVPTQNSTTSDNDTSADHPGDETEAGNEGNGGNGDQGHSEETGGGENEAENIVEDGDEDDDEYGEDEDEDGEIPLWKRDRFGCKLCEQGKLEFKYHTFRFIPHMLNHIRNVHNIPDPECGLDVADQESIKSSPYLRLAGKYEGLTWGWTLH